MQTQGYEKKKKVGNTGQRQKTLHIYNGSFAKRKYREWEREFNLKMVNKKE